MAEPTREEIIASMNAAAERMGLDLEDLQEMIDEVIEDCTAKAGRLREAAEASNAEDVRALAHDIKGSTANYGLPIASEMAKTIEKNNENPSIELITELHQYVSALKGLNLRL